MIYKNLTSRKIYLFCYFINFINFYFDFTGWNSRKEKGEDEEEKKENLEAFGRGHGILQTGEESIISGEVDKCREDLVFAYRLK